MGSPRQNQANRQNAQKSTGPRTDSGKMISRMNSLKHGFNSKIVVPESEKSEELELIRWEWISSFKPTNRAALLVADAAFRSHRVYSRALDAAEIAYAKRCNEAHAMFTNGRAEFNQNWIEQLCGQPIESLANLQSTEDGCGMLIDTFDGIELALKKRDWTECEATLLTALQGHTRSTAPADQTDPLFDLVDLMAYDKELDDPYTGHPQADVLRQARIDLPPRDSEVYAMLDEDQLRQYEEADQKLNDIAEAGVSRRTQLRAKNNQRIQSAIGVVSIVMSMVRSELEAARVSKDGEFARSLRMALEASKFDNSDEARLLDRYLGQAQRNAERDLKMAIAVCGASLWEMDDDDQNEAKEKSDGSSECAGESPPPAA